MVTLRHIPPHEPASELIVKGINLGQAVTLHLLSHLCHSLDRDTGIFSPDCRSADKEDRGVVRLIQYSGAGVSHIEFFPGTFPRQES